MLLVVVPVDAPGPVAPSEVEQEGRQVVRQLAIIDSGAPERVPDGDVEEQRLRGDQHGADREQPLEQIRRVEQRVRSFRRQPPLEIGPTMRGATAQ
jgi:hypothetical protein